MPEIYLDNHSGARPYPALIDALALLYKKHFASLSSLHTKGDEQILPFNKAVDILYTSVGAKKEDLFIFCENGEIAINESIFSGYYEGTRNTGKNHFLTTQVENEAIIQSMKRLEKFGCATKYLPLNVNGQITKEVLEEHIGPRTAFLSLSWAHGLTGVIQPMEEIAAVCKEKGILLHVDASYILGKSYFRFQDYPIDFLSFSGDKIHAPKGTGGLFVKEGIPFTRLIVGKGELNTPLVSALSYAAFETTHNFEHICTETARLRDLLEKEIQAEIKDAVIVFKNAERLPNTSVIAFPGVISEALLFELNYFGVYASIGGGMYPTLSTVLKGCRLDPILADSALSFSLSYETTEEEILLATQKIIAAVKKLKTYSQEIFNAY